MRNILALVLATFALSGCVALEFGAIGEAGIGVEMAGATEVGAAGGVGGAAEIGLSDDLAETVTDGVRSGTRQGELSNAFDTFTDGGQRPGRFHINDQGTISASGRPVAQLNSSGEVFSGNRKIGFVAGDQPRLFEYLKDGSTQPVAILEGFVPEDGVRIVSQGDGTVVRLLRRDVAVDIVGFGDGQYLIRLASGENVWIPAGVLSLALLDLKQLAADCPDGDQEGAVVRQSGEMVRFKHCEKADGSFILSGDDGDTIIDAYDVRGVLSGDGIPGVKGDDARQRLVNYAQAAATAVGQQPGAPAMTYLASAQVVPVLEQQRYDDGPPPVFAGPPPVQSGGGERRAYAEDRRAPTMDRSGERMGGGLVRDVPAQADSRGPGFAGQPRQDWRPPPPRFSPPIDRPAGERQAGDARAPAGGPRFEPRQGSFERRGADGQSRGFNRNR